MASSNPLNGLGRLSRFGLVNRLGRFAPGLVALLQYKRADLPSDLMAGLSVAAVALPVGVAYAQLAGFDPVVGLYACIFPLLVYALLGSSRQLILGPDAATCALIATAIMPLAPHDPALYLSLATGLTAFAGIFCVLASFLRFGVLADFLSKPILVGFLNGVSLHILFGQLQKLLGFDAQGEHLLAQLSNLVWNIKLTHLPTLSISILTFLVLLLLPRFLPRWPSALLALVMAGAVVGVLGLDDHGVRVIGTVRAGLPSLSWPVFPAEYLDEIVTAAAGIAFVSFSSMMLTARSFADKNRYAIDGDRELAALGVADIASAMSGSFAISGADSRTAMADTAGSKSHLAGIVAALTIAIVLLWLTEPLRYVPVAALGAVLIMASLSLLDIKILGWLLKFSRMEFALSIIVTIGVLWFGAFEAIVLAVVLAVLRFVQLSARPPVEILGKVDGEPGFHAIARHPNAMVEPGMMIVRFNAPLVFFNARYFEQAIKKAIADKGPALKWLILDAMPITQIDVTGYGTMSDLIQKLQNEGITVAIAGRRQETIEWRKSRGLPSMDELAVLIFPTLRKAVRAYRLLANPVPVNPAPIDPLPDTASAQPDSMTSSSDRDQDGRVDAQIEARIKEPSAEPSEGQTDQQANQRSP